MHLAYLESMRHHPISPERRRLLKLGAALLATPAAVSAKGFKGEGRMDMSTGEDWIDTFFNGGAAEIIHYYADDFVFEDVTLFQTIRNKDELYRAFLPFNNAGPDSPAGVHQFDIVRYDGGKAGDRKGIARQGVPEGYTAQEWARWSAGPLAGVNLDYDEWAVMNWVWKAKHNMDDFLGIPNAKGKTTVCHGITFHCYRNRKVVRDFTHWNLRDVAVQLGHLPPPVRFWEAPKG
jgi:steroid delta-isomerase-like uncharacterized protein